MGDRRFNFGNEVGVTRRYARRRGSIYFFVLGSTMMLTVLGLSIVTAARLRGRASFATDDATEARNYALAATEIGRLRISQDPNWRTDYVAGYWINHAAIGAGTFSLYVFDPNGTGALNQGDSEPVTLIGTGYKGNVQQQVQVTLNAQPTPYTCLGYALFSNGSQTYSGSGNALACDGMAASNGSILATATNFNATNLQAGSFELTSCSGTGTRTTSAAAITYPDAGSAFDYYITNGTTLNPSLFPVIAGVKTIDRALLSPTTNPFGTANPKGIYVIDCAGSSVAIQNSRVVGTLVVLNASSTNGFTVQQSVVWEPAVNNYPALMVQGNLAINFTTAALSESSPAPAVNFNPPGVPYPFTIVTGYNATTTDTFSSALNGLVYASGNITFTGTQAMKGTVIAGGAITFSSAPLTLIYDATFITNPPPSFCGPPKMVVAPGSWR